MRIGLSVLALSMVGLPGNPRAASSADKPEVSSSRVPEAASSSSSGEVAEWQPAMTEDLPPHHLRSFAEMGVGLGLGAFLYWAFYNRNIADWDDPRIEERFDGQAWRFDNNSLGVNFMAHAFEGAGAYVFARGNHQSVLAAFGYSTLTSFLWEFVLEFREKVSVNDLISTSTTGVPIGEFFHKLGLYLDSGAERGGVASALGWLLGPGVKLDRVLDGRPPVHVVNYDNLGLSRSIWHRFAVRYALDFMNSPGIESYSRGRVQFSGRLATVDGYLGPRTFSRAFHRADIAHFSAGGEFSEHGPGMELAADTVLAGYHVQRMQGSPEQPVLVAGTFGVSMAYSFLYSQANQYADFEEAVAVPSPPLSYHIPTTMEQYAAAHLPGPEVDWHARLPMLEMSVRVRGYPSFAALSAPAFYDFAAIHLEDELKHVLHRQGYFYGWGGTGFVDADLRAGPLLFRGYASYGRYRSQQGLDRHIEEVTNDAAAEGDILRYGANVELGPLSVPVSLGVGYDVRRYRSWVGAFERHARAAAYSVTGSFEF